MRIVKDDAHIKIIATDEYHFKGDRLFVEMSLKQGNFLEVEATVGGERFTAVSGGGYIKMDMTNVYKRLQLGYLPISLSYTIDASATDSLVIPFKNNNGKTLSDRTHASIVEVEVPKKDTPVNFLALGPCDYNNGQTFGSATQMGVRSLNAPANMPDEYLLTIAYKAPHLIGDIRMAYMSTIQKIHVRYNCIQQGGVCVTYLDIDGCKRYAVGKIIDESLKVATVEWPINTNEISSEVTRMVIGGSKSLRVGFANVPFGQHIEDCLLSEEVFVEDADGEIKIPCAPIDGTSTRNGINQNFYVNLKILEI